MHAQQTRKTVPGLTSADSPQADVSALAWLTKAGHLRMGAAARRLITDEPQRELVVEELLNTATGLLNGQPGAAVIRRIHTLRREYTARLSSVEAELFGGEAAVLILLEAVQGELAVLNSLRARFGLTRREAGVALLIIARHANAEIAERLFISKHTARHHVERILQKLGVRSRRHARSLMLSDA